MVREDCFAYNKKKKECHCLNELDCSSCSFYRNKSSIKDNPFYEYSYRDKEKFEKDKKKNLIKGNQILK